MGWETDTGLLDDYDFAVDRAQFATDGRYQSGEVLLLQWFGTATGPDGSVIYDHQVMIPCGSGWESRDGGKTAVHPAGGDKNFQRQSYLGRIIERCVKEFGMSDLLKARGEPNVAASWEGLKWHFKRESFDFGGEIGTKEREMPVAFLGEIAEGGNGSSAPAQPAANANVLLAKIKAEAKSAASHGDFVDTVMEKYPEVADDDKLLEQVVDEAGIFTQARG